LQPRAFLAPRTLHRNVVKTSFGDYLQVLRLAGASFESADEDSVNTWHELLNVLLRNVASPNIALWTHIVRRRERAVVPQEGPDGFADTLGRSTHGGLPEKR